MGHGAVRQHRLPLRRLGESCAQKAGVDTTKYTNVVYVWPKTTSCGWAGLATLGGNQAWINGSMTIPAVAHELGHNLGVHHASALKCTLNGTPVPWSSTCTAYEYGDPFSVMGVASHTARHHHGLQLGQFGWVPELIDITASGSYTISPAELTAQPRLFRIARGDGTFLYFEFRRPYGAFDAYTSTDPVVNGVTIRVAADKPTRSQSYLLDMVPSTTSFADAPLAAGATFTDPLTKISITTTSVSASMATIQVTYPGTVTTDVQPPSVPGSLTATANSSSTVAVSWAASSDNVGVAGYRVFRNGTLLATTTTTGYADSGLAPATAYSYTVVAFDAAGNTGPAATVSATTLPLADTTPPSAPGSFGASATDSTTVALSWTVSSDNVGVAGYRVSRNGTLLTTTTTTGYADSGLAAGHGLRLRGRRVRCRRQHRSRCHRIGDHFAATSHHPAATTNHTAGRHHPAVGSRLIGRLCDESIDRHVELDGQHRRRGCGRLQRLPRRCARGHRECHVVYRLRARAQHAPTATR